MASTEEISAKLESVALEGSETESRFGKIPTGFTEIKHGNQLIMDAVSNSIIRKSIDPYGRY